MSGMHAWRLTSMFTHRFASQKIKPGQSCQNQSASPEKCHSSFVQCGEHTQSFFGCIMPSFHCNPRLYPVRTSTLLPRSDPLPFCTHIHSANGARLYSVQKREIPAFCAEEASGHVILWIQGTSALFQQRKHLCLHSIHFCAFAKPCQWRAMECPQSLHLQHSLVTSFSEPRVTPISITSHCSSIWMLCYIEKCQNLLFFLCIELWIEGLNPALAPLTPFAIHPSALETLQVLWSVS